MEIEGEGDEEDGVEHTEVAEFAWVAEEEIEREIDEGGDEALALEGLGNLIPCADEGPGDEEERDQSGA